MEKRPQTMGEFMPFTRGNEATAAVAIAPDRAPSYAGAASAAVSQGDGGRSTDGRSAG